MKPHKYDKLFTYLFFLILVAGLFLRFYQYLMGRSLWEDETHLALNFFDRGFFELTKPLDHMQGAPVFFLFAVKLMVSIFGYTDLAFRSFPFLVSILTLPLFYYLVLELTSRKAAALIAFFLLAANVSLIYFSSELKPYAVDAGLYVLMTFLAVSSNGFVTRNRIILLSIAGCLAIMFSLSAFIVLFAIAADMLLKWIRQKKVQMGGIRVMISWLCVFLLNYFLFIHNHPSTEGQRYNYESAFMPLNLSSPEFSAFFNRTIDDVFFYALLFISKDLYFSYVLVVILIVGVIALLVHKKTTLLLFTLLPVVVHLFLSALKIYPFVHRLILYLIPALLIWIAYGTYVIAAFIGTRAHVIAGVLVALVCCFFLTKESFKAFPLWQREIKPMLNYINDSLPPQAHIYAADPVNAYTYYYKTGYVKNPVYKEMQWQVDPPEYYEMVSDETENYLLIYGQEYWWGYGDVIEDLKKRQLIVRTFAMRGYAVSEVKPLPREKGHYTKMLDHKWFDPALKIEGQNIVALWGGEVVARPLRIPRGKYSISVVSSGTPLEGVFPHQNVFINNKKIGDFYASRWDSRNTFDFEMQKDTSITIKITMDNDAASKTEDRNTFINNIYVMQTGE